MAGWMPLRLRHLLGRDLDAVDGAGLERLIGLPEDGDLEFKRQAWAATEGDAKEAGYDIAAMANAAGGLLILGMDEDSSGHATGLRPDPDVARDVGLWVHQVVAARILPTSTVAHRALHVDGGMIHLVSVAPSLLRPHAVSAGGGALRYPLRTGTTRRFLTEPEVADVYRRRFGSLQDQEERVTALHREGEALAGGREQDRFPAWMVVACVPDMPGDVELRRGLAEEWLERVRPALRDFPAYGREPLHHAAAGYRCIEMHDSLQPHDPPCRVGCRLYLDGAAVIVFGYHGGRGAVGIPGGATALYDEFLFGDLVNAVVVLAGHALRAGAVGNTVLSGQLLCDANPMVLAQHRADFPGILHNTRPVGAPTPIARHTVPLAATSVPSQDSLAAARLVAMDLFSNFGVAEPPQVTRENQLVQRFFNREWQPRVATWAEAAGVPLI